MKRLLVEILCGLAVVVLLVSFHHQITKLKEQNHEVSQLKTLIQRTSTTSRAKTDITAVRSQLMEHLDNRLATMEAQLTEVHREAKEASCIHPVDKLIFFAAYFYSPAADDKQTGRFFLKQIRLG